LDCVLLTTFVAVVYHVTYINEPTKAWHMAIVTKVTCTGRCLMMKTVKLKIWI